MTPQEERDEFEALEGFYTEALLYRASQPKRAKRALDPASKEHADAKRMRDLFALPENWTRTRGIAMIHKESKTLLGNFSEYLHNSVKNCRKLIREHQPISIQATEEVEGSWWLGERKPYVDASMKWTQTREAIINVQLPELGVAHPVTEVVVGLYLGGIMRVELAADTQFASPGGEVLLTLAKGTNLLECMSLESKMELRRELGL